MDQELRKAGKMASATVRKQRAQERQRQKELIYEQREERKKRFMRYSEIYSTDSGSDASRANSPENDSVTGTPSECSVKTPENSLSPDVEIKVQTQIPDLRIQTTTQKEVEVNPRTQSSILERRRSKSKTEKPAVLGASLNRLCDFRYDRFSTIIEPVITQEQEEETSDSSSGSEEGEEDDYSPIEVATPVAIRMPISRPSVISVVSTNSEGMGPQKFSVKNINTIMINPPRPLSRPASRLPSQQEQTPVSRPQSRPTAMRSTSGFLAAEASPLDMTTPSNRSVISIDPPSTRSLPPAETPVLDHALKKKSSMPMLTKFTHARMNSIKNFMKTQSISGPPPAVPMIPISHQSRPSESVNQILSSTSSHKATPSVASGTLPPSPRRSLTEPNLPRVAQYDQRPQTARAPSQDSVTTLSRFPPPPQPSQYYSPAPSALSQSQTPASTASEDSEPAMGRKKSFSNLRRRSGSLGQALKISMSSKGKTPSTTDAPMPPVPNMTAANVPQRDSRNIEPRMSMNFPTPPPPPKTPRNGMQRKSGLHMYSAFPPPSQKGEPVGLGLRM